MSINIMAEVWDHAPARGGELLFLIALADQAGDDDRCAWPGGQRLAQRVRCDERSLYRYADKLQAKHIIEKVPDDERPARYRSAGGRETTCWRILPREEWLADTPDNLSPDNLSPLTFVQGNPTECHPTPDPSVSRTVREPSSKNRSTRSAVRRIGAEVPNDDEGMVAGELPDEPAGPPVIRKPKRKTAANLAHYFVRWSTSAYPMSPDSSVSAPLATNVRRWMSDGIDPVTVESAMELFFTDDRFHRSGQPLWRSFVYSFADLVNRAGGREGLPEIKPVVLDIYDTKEQEPMSYAERKARDLGQGA